MFFDAKLFYYFGKNMKRSKILPAIKTDQHHHGWNGFNKSIVEYVEFFETSKRKEAKSKEKVSNILMLA